MGEAPARGVIEFGLAALRGVLDLVEKPAALVAGDGVIVASNEMFGALLSRRGIAASDRLSALLTGESFDRVMRGANSSPALAGRAPLELFFRGGDPASVLVETIPAGFAGGAAILVVAAPEVDEDEATLRAAASLRHDVAGPLTAVIGAAELLLLNAGSVAPELRRRATSILESCGQISEILQRRRAADRGAAGASR